jgi:stage II sporulation protein D
MLRARLRARWHGVAGSLLAGLLAAGVAASPAAAQSAVENSAGAPPAGTSIVREPGTAQTVTISGGGWGHGIGMSQYGAYGRALQGRSATEILTKYYKGAGVETVNTPRSIRVGLLQGRSQITVTSAPFGSGDGAVSFKVAGSSESVAEGDEGTEWRVEASNTGGMRLFKDGTKVNKDGKTVFGDPDHALVMDFGKYGSLVSVSGKPHKYAYGKLKFGTYSTPCGSAYCLRLVLQLPMQKYLFGLSEVPASWPAAVLEAQAIAGRTYAFSKIKRVGQHLSPCDCAVYDSTVDQAYTGDTKRTGSGQYWADWKNAVKATNRKVAIYQGDPIQALYSSSSGGHTENNENVWGGTPIPYLRGVSDKPDNVAANPNHKWSVDMAWATLRQKFDAKWGIGKLQKFKLIRPFGVSGRVTVVKTASEGGVKIVGSNKTVRADGWDIRQTLGLKDTLFRLSATTAAPQQ